MLLHPAGAQGEAHCEPVLDLHRAAEHRERRDAEIRLAQRDLAGNARLFAVVEKARKASVTRDVIERAIAKGAGTGGDKTSLEHIIFEGYAPHKVPVIVEVYTDNHQRTAPDIRQLFRRGV